MVETLHPRQNLECSYQELTIIIRLINEFADTDTVLSGPQQNALASMFDKATNARARMIASQRVPRFFLARHSD